MINILKKLAIKFGASRVLICSVDSDKEQKFFSNEPIFKINIHENYNASGVKPFFFDVAKHGPYIYKYSKELGTLFKTKEFFFCKDLQKFNYRNLSLFERMYKQNNVYTARAFMLKKENYFLVFHWDHEVPMLSKKEIKEELSLISNYLKILNS